MIENLLKLKILNFLAVGGFCTGLQYGILIISIKFTSIPVVTASSLGFFISLIANYILNKHFTFKSDISHLKAFPKFIIVAFLGLTINIFFMMLFHDIAQMHYLLSQIITTSIVMVFNYILHCYWSFKDTSRFAFRK